MTKRILNTIYISIFSITLLNIASKPLGLIREIITASLFGTSVQYDMYLLASTIPLLISYFCEAALSAVFIPIFIELLKNDNKKEAIILAKTLFTIILTLGTIICILGIISSPILTEFIGPSLNQDYAIVTKNIMIVLFPIVIISSINGLLVGILNAHKKFIYPALGPAIINIVQIFSMKTISIEIGVYSIAIGLLLGSIAWGILMFYQCTTLYKFNSVRINFKHRELTKIKILILPVIIGISIDQINIIIDRIMASGLPEGSISALNYANRVINLPVSLFAGAIATVLFPIFSEYVAENRLLALRDKIRHYFVIVSFITIPIITLFILLRYPIVTILFKRGAFTDRSLEMTVTAILFYSISIFSLSMRHILIRLYFSLQDTITPVKTGFVAVLVNIILNLILIKPMQHGGLALSSSIALTLNVFLMIYLINKNRLPNFINKDCLISFCKIIFCNVLLGIIYSKAINIIFNKIAINNTVQGAIYITIISMSYIFIYLLILYFVRLKEFNFMHKIIKEKLTTKR